MYVVTSSQPTLDQAIAAIAFAYLQQRVDRSVHTQRRYVPVISSARQKCLKESLPELALALQAALVGEENVIFQDDEVYKRVNAYTSRKKVVLVGGTAMVGEEGWKEWAELYGAELFGVIDTENTLPKEIHDVTGGVNERLQVALFPQEKSVRGGGEAEPALSSLVALWAKEQIAAMQEGEGEKIVTKELADLLLAAIVLESDNLAESNTNFADLGAVGWLNSRSSFAQEQTTSGTQEQNDDDDEVNDDEANAPNFDAFVPTFPDLDAMYRALRGASRQSSAANAVKVGAIASTTAAAEELGSSSPDHFQWNLITNTLANLDEERKATVPESVSKTIVGDFAAVLTSALAKRLFKPIGVQLGQSLRNGSGAFDLGSLQKQINTAVVAEVTSESQGFEALCVAISALHAFVQINWTGPELPDSLQPVVLLRGSAPTPFPLVLLMETQRRR